MAPVLLALALLAAPAPQAAPATLVVCAPGYPGTAAEAQPRMDRLAAAAARAAGWPEGSLAAAYEPGEDAGVARLRGDRGAALALVPLPFLVEHGAALRLRPRLAVTARGASEQVWSLVAKRGRVRAPADLAPFALQSVAGYAPPFVRGALREFGALPASTRIVQSAQVLSGLRRAAAGEDVALLLDAAQAAALPGLPYATELEVVARSAPLPTAFVATVGDRLPPARWAALERALAGLAGDPDGAAALRDLELEALAPASDAALAAVRRLAQAAR
jgi:hypothetical protein